MKFVKGPVLRAFLFCGTYFYERNCWPGRRVSWLTATYFLADARSSTSSAGPCRAFLRKCEKAACHRANLQQRSTPQRGLPENSIAKNFASRTTYPHSARTHFENRLAKRRT